MNTKLKPITYNLQPQAGVTLLLALLVLSGLILVTLAVAALTIQEIRSSRAQSASEPAINAAETGAEQGLWELKRGGSVANCDTSPPSTTLPGSNTAVMVCKSYTGDNFVITTTPMDLFLYDPNNPVGDTDLSGYPYSSLSVTNTGSFAVDVKVYRIDDTVSPIALGQANPSATLNLALPAPGPGTEGRMQVTMKTLSSTAPVYVTTHNGATETGLPDVVNLDSSGCSSKSTVSSCVAVGQELYTRKIRVKLK